MSHLAHGNSSLTIEGDIVVLELKASFNKEGVKLVHSKLSSFIIEKSLDEWNLVIFMDEETLLTLDAIEDTRAFFLWCQKFKCKKVAYVSISLTQTSVSELIFENVSLERGFFTSFEQAKHWIISDK